MGKFDELAANIENVELLSKATTEDLEVIREKIPNVDLDYLEFLRTVGYGNLGDIQLFSGVINPADIYSAPRHKLNGVLLFGDDMQGHCFGFKLDENMRVIEIDPRGEVSRSVKSSFFELMKAYLG